jgi:hypothetical protein
MIDEGVLVSTTFGVLALILAAVIFMGFYFRYRARADAQATIRTALEKGQQLSPELLERLMTPIASTPDRRNIDLRRGVILVALGMGIFAIGLAATPSLREAVAFAAPPLAIGLAYIALWKFAPRG